MTELLQEPLVLIVNSLVSVICLFIIFIIGEFRNKISKWIQSRTDNEQRELLNKWSEEAFAYVETVFKDIKGQDKLDSAILYVSRQAKSKGLNLQPYEIQAAIEKAVLLYKNKQ